MSYIIKKILVPVDFSEISELAIDTAAAIAQRCLCDLTFLYVIQHNDYYFSVLPESVHLIPPVEEIKEKVHKKLEAIQIRVQHAFKRRAELVVLTGNIESEIRAYATSENVDLIVMGTHGVSGYKEVFIGSNAQRVVTLSDIPVLTVTRSNITGFENILMPFDHSLYSRQKVNIASVVAAIYNSHVHILGILDSEDKEDLRKMKIKLQNVEGIIAGKELKFTTTIKVASNMAKTALAYAAENNCDLMVINTGHESEITGVFLGAFAQQIVNHSPIPVLSIKPLEGTFSTHTSGSAV